jgi:uncharacterized protein YfdQ (DUF2303 family)
MELTDKAIEAIAKLTRLTQQPIDHPQGGKAIMRPDGVIDWLEPVDPPLTHIRQQVKAYNAESFAAYVNTYKEVARDDVLATAQTTIFAELPSYKVKAIIDYHAPGVAEYCHHTVLFEVPMSDEWRRWATIEGRPMGQVEFAEFLEENCNDIVDPPAAVFLDIVTTLQAKKNVSFTSGIRLSDGSNQLAYSEEIEAKGKGQLTLPSSFDIGVPVFEGGEAYKVRVLLRYRLTEGKITFTVKLHRRQFLQKTAFQDICTAIAEKTGLPVLAAWA